MRLSESHSLPVPLVDAWGALNDLAVLQHALPGCKSLLQIAANEFVGEIAIPLGPVTSNVTIHVHRRDIDAPRGCTLYFESRSLAGGGTGSAAMHLTPEADAATTLRVDVEVEIGGIVAQLSAPLIDLAAHQMAALFFQRFRQGAIARQSGAAIP